MNLNFECGFCGHEKVKSNSCQKIASLLSPKARHITTVEVKLQKLNNFWKTGRLKLVVKNLIITEYQLFSRNMNFCIIYNLIINIEMK